MENRYEKVVFEAERGTTFEVSEGTNGELVIRTSNISSNNVISELPIVSAGEYAKVLSVYTDKAGNKVVVPPGWTVTGAKSEITIWGRDEGLVIYRIPERKVSTIRWSDEIELEKLKETYDQLVWMPVSLLQPNGTLDGNSFTEKFGRRNYRNNKFSESEYHEELVGDLELQKRSIDRYGGCYITRYHISQDPVTEKPRSVKNKYPWVCIDEPTSANIAKTFVKGETVNAHLTYGAEYDTRAEWVKETGTMNNICAIAEDSTEWGNYCNAKNSSKRLEKTGSREEWCVNNIYDFAGNMEEWTQERNGNWRRVIRGGAYDINGDYCPVAHRNCDDPFNAYSHLGFRITLYIK